MKESPSNCVTCEPPQCIIPSLFSFVTLRQERFGALIFNPYMGMGEELDPIEAYIARLCNDYNSFRQIDVETQKRFGLASSESRRRTTDTMKKLSKMCAVTFYEGKEPPRPRLPDTLVFPDDGPCLSAPKNVIWDVTYACNLHCPHCLTDSGKRLEKELDTTQAIFLIDRLAEAKVFSLSLSGGEPFLRPDILTLLQYISKTNMRVDIATNGVELPERILLGLRNLPVFQVQVSIDGIGKQHDRFRKQRGAFEAACHTVHRLKEEGIVVSLSTTVTKENKDALDQIIDLAVNLGCSGFKAIPFLPAGRGQKNAHRLSLDLEDHLFMSKILIERRRELKGRLNISTETCFPFLLEPPPSETYTNGPVGCSAGYDTLSIGADGICYPCPFLHDFPLGNLIDYPLTYLWREAPTLRTLRTLQKKDLGEPCKNCRYSPLLCRGGCRAAAYLKYGNLTAGDPTCFQPLVKFQRTKQKC